MRKHLRNLALLLLLLLAVGCSQSYPHDKAWVSDEKFGEAQRIYDTTGSLNLTEKALDKAPTWQRAEINEALYRLKKLKRLE